MDGPMHLSDEQRERMSAADSARQESERRAREERQAAREQAERDGIERAVRASFVGTPAEFEAEKDELIRAERHRIAHERDAAARAANAARYR